MQFMRMNRSPAIRSRLNAAAAVHIQFVAADASTHGGKGSCCFQSGLGGKLFPPGKL